MLWSTDNCQNSESADHYRLTVSRAQVSTHWVPVFFEINRWKCATFRMIAGSSSIFWKCIWNMLCSWAALLKFWFQTDLGRENSASYCRQGRQLLLLFLWSRFSHALRPTFMLWLVKIWQVSSCGNFMQHLETCFLIAEADRVLCRYLVMFLNVLFH